MDSPSNKSKIAVIGAGIAGLSAAWGLSRQHDVTLYEQNSYLGGHSNTVDVNLGGEITPVDTGFIVFNPPNYPYLCGLFKHLEVDTLKTNMSFGVSLNNGAFEYAGSDLNGLFAQRRNILRPHFWRMIADIRRFYSSAPLYLQSLESLSVGKSIGELLIEHKYSSTFVEQHLIPMAAAIWSTSLNDIRAYPADAFLRFFANHGLLELGERPLWHTVKGGSREYVKRLVADTRLQGSVKQAACEVVRGGDQVSVKDLSGQSANYDEIVLATHADDALALLTDPSVLEREVLGKFRYSLNDAVLHEDARLMPKRRAAWSSWNYLQFSDTNAINRPLCVSYWMNRLQGFKIHRDIIVTLNPAIEPDSSKVHGRYHYSHPIFDHATSRAQTQSIEIQGTNRTWFCGSYLGHGFHEDGVEAGLWVAEQHGCPVSWGLDNPYPRLPHSYTLAQRKAA